MQEKICILYSTKKSSQVQLKTKLIETIKITTKEEILDFFYFRTEDEKSLNEKQKWLILIVSLNTFYDILCFHAHVNYLINHYILRNSSKGTFEIQFVNSWFNLCKVIWV